MSCSIVRTGLVAACLSIIAFCPSLASAQTPKTDAAALESLQGVWKIVRWQDKTVEELPDDLQEHVRPLRIVIKGNQMTDAKNSLAKTVKLDVKAPQAIDLSYELPRSTFNDVGDALANPDRPKKKMPEYETITMRGIFKVEGDRLTLAVIDRDGSDLRPRDFNVRDEPPTMVFVLVRVK